MREKEIFDLVVKHIKSGLSVEDIIESADLLLGSETLEAWWSMPRRNINCFLESCLASLRLEPPFLDLGCGRRSLKPEILQRYGDHTAFVGIDHYLPARVGNNPLRLPNIMAKAENIPLLSSSVGTVFCLELLEHVPNEQVVISEIYRILYPGGHLLLSLPGLDIPQHEKLPFQRDYRRYSSTQTEVLLKAHNFTDIRITEKELEGLQINIFATALKQE